MFLSGLWKGWFVMNYTEEEKLKKLKEYRNEIDKIYVEHKNALDEMSYEYKCAFKELKEETYFKLKNNMEYKNQIIEESKQIHLNNIDNIFRFKLSSVHDECQNGDDILSSFDVYRNNSRVDNINQKAQETILNIENERWKRELELIEKCYLAEVDTIESDYKTRLEKIESEQREKYELHNKKTEEKMKEIKLKHKKLLKGTDDDI